MLTTKSHQERLQMVSFYTQKYSSLPWMSRFLKTNLSFLKLPFKGRHQKNGNFGVILYSKPMNPGPFALEIENTHHLENKTTNLPPLEPKINPTLPETKAMTQEPQKKLQVYNRKKPVHEGEPSTLR